MAFHCYGGQQGMSAFHQQFTAMQELMTECSPGIIPYAPAEAAIDAVRNWSSSVDFWNVALNQNGGPVQAPNSGCRSCVGLVTVNKRTGAVSYNQSYYQLGQLSRFVQRGAVRIGTPRWVHDYRDSRWYHVSAGLDNVAFLNPNGSRVLVAYNNSPAAISFGVGWNGKKFDYTLGARATVTFVWNPTKAGASKPDASVGTCFNAGDSYALAGDKYRATPDC
jgi:glucosylceramidase